VKLKLVLAAVCLVVAALALALARDVWLWEKAIRDADRRAQFARIEPASWEAATVLPGGPALRLLGIHDDLAYRRLYDRASAVAAETSSATTSQRSLLEADLARVSRTTNAVAASAAANLLGVLFFTDPDDPENSPAERAVGAFQDATLSDPANASAKANLELILRQLSTSQLKGRSSPGGGDKGGRGGAGLAPGGKGY